MEISLLFDFYGQLLTEQQAQAISLYYNNEFSLAEIAARMGITRLGVRDSIKHAEEKLLNYEKKLGLLSRFQETEQSLSRIEQLAQSLKENYDTDIADEIISTAKSLHE